MDRKTYTPDIRRARELGNKSYVDEELLGKTSRLLVTW